MRKATDTVKLHIKTHQGKDYLPTQPASIGGKNYFYLFTGGNDGNDGDISWPVGIPTTTLNVKLVPDNYTIANVVFIPAPGSTASNFSYKIGANQQHAIITDTNTIPETVGYCVGVNVPGGQIKCDPTIKNS
jgi:hypothetical protein